MTQAKLIDETVVGALLCIRPHAKVLFASDYLIEKYRA